MLLRPVQRQRRGELEFVFRRLYGVYCVIVCVHKISGGVLSLFSSFLSVVVDIADVTGAGLMHTTVTFYYPIAARSQCRQPSIR